jgi:hypothetical protein
MLTDDEIKRIHLEETGFDLDESEAALIDFARAIEQSAEAAAIERCARIVEANAERLKTGMTTQGATALIVTADQIRALLRTEGS